MIHQRSGIDHLAPAPSEVRQQLARLLRSTGLRSAPRQQRLLRHIVDASLAGEMDRLKGYVLGVEVFDRGAAFDPNLDPIVRVEVGRLRGKLLAYFSVEGARDPVLIEVPKGGNAAQFRLRGAADGSERPRVAERRADRPRLAVVPFRSLSSDGGHELLADAITEDLVTELSKLSALFVVSRHAAFTLRESKTGGTVIADDLGVRYTLEGSVRVITDLRITVRLVDTRRDEALWAERYDCTLHRLPEVRDDIADQIIRALALRRSPSEEARLGQVAASSAESRSLVQRGIGLYWTYTDRGLEQAQDAFAEAVGLDADYAAAHAWLALAAGVRYGLGLDHGDALPCNRKKRSRQGGGRFFLIRTLPTRTRCWRWRFWARIGSTRHWRRANSPYS